MPTRGNSVFRRIITGRTGRFIWLVVVPFVLSATYYGFIETERYVSTAVFSVRSSDSVVSPSFELGGFAIGGSSAQDIYFVQQYLMSWDLLEILDSEIELRKAWSDSLIDPISRLSADASNENFLKYYQNMLSIKLDSTSHMITIEVQGFDAQYTQNMLKVMLNKSEEFVNKLTNNLAYEQLYFVTEEIETNWKRLVASRSALLAFQNEHVIVDPKVDASQIASVIAQLQSNLAEAQTQLIELRGYLSETAPDVVSVKRRIQALITQIDTERKRLTGSGAIPLNNIMMEYENLLFDVEFANEIYRTSLVSLEKVHIEASKKIKSLVVVAQPNLPDEVTYPDRPYMLATITAFLLLTFGILSVIYAAVREHMT